MDDTERQTAKRSRFDQTEPEPKRTSRFDRRSRSPPARRSRSPASGSPAPRSGIDPAAAAAAAAAKINAQLQAKKAIQHVDVPPIRSTASPSAPAPSVKSPSGGNSASNINGEMYVADGDYIRDIEVNDLRNRYTLTKGSTQKTIKEETGADVTTRGEYYPDKSMATAANPPLYLHVTSQSKAGLEKAVEKIEELMKQELPNLVDERRFRRREPDAVERDEFGRRKWPEERIPIDFEPVPGFNLRAQVVGHQGAYVKHIQQETRCRVQIKGRGSGFMEQGTGRESDEDMYLHVAGPDPKEVEHAKTLCEDLLANVREQYEEFKARGPQSRGYGDRGPSTGYGGQSGYGDRQGGYGDRGGYGNRGGDRQNYGDRSNSFGGDRGNGYGGYNSPAPNNQASETQSPAGASNSPAPAMDAATQAQYAAYYAQNPGADPYAAYGGYAAYAQYYQQYMAAYAQQQGTPGTAGSAAPPPPPSDSAPPPPPPGGSTSTYSNVPPPPGL